MWKGFGGGLGPARSASTQNSINQMWYNEKCFLTLNINRIIMKRVALFLVSFLTIAVFFSSCEKETILSIDQTSITVPDTGGSQTITLTANKPWTVSSNQSWCRTSPSAGEEAASTRITITCDANTSYDARSCIVTFTCAEMSGSVNVTQAASNGLLVSQTEYNVSNAAQQLNIEVKANVKFSVEVDNGCKDWVKYNTTKGLTNSTVVLDIAKNDTYDGREGKVTIKQTDGSLSSTVTIKQGQTDGLFLTTSEYNLSVNFFSNFLNSLLYFFSETDKNNFLLKLFLLLNTPPLKKSLKL